MTFLPALAVLAEAALATPSNPRSPNKGAPDSSKSRYESFQAFYPFYLSEHQNGICRRLHFLGSLLVLITLAAALFYRKPALLLLMPVIGYGFAWVGHFVFEKNRPATFSYPLYSLMGDWVMFWQLLTRKIPFDPR